MSYNLKVFKIKNIDILTFLISVILYFKFFILNDHVPLHDEVTAIERFTEWKNFLRKDKQPYSYINLWSIGKINFGFDLSIFRLVSFFSFVGIIFLFNRIFNNFLLFIILLIIYIQIFIKCYTFRGYYIYALLSCLLLFLNFIT